MFTEGILLMQKTLLGVIQIDPRDILEEGLRRELVRLIAQALHNNLCSFNEMSGIEINTKYSKLAATLDGIKRSIEYVQDFINFPGLKIYQEEMTRIINYNVEQEANKYLKKKIFDNISRYQNKTIPIPKFQLNAAQQQQYLKSILIIQNKNDKNLIQYENANHMTCMNFMGRVLESLLFLTDSSKTVYAPEHATWYLYYPANESSSSNNIIINQNKSKMTTSEICGLRFFSLLDRALG